VRHLHPLTRHELGDRFDLERAVGAGLLPSIYFSDDSDADLNVLLYASDEGSERHGRARELLERCITEREICCFGWPTLMGYLRVATHPGVFDRPLSPDQAMRNVERLLDVPHVRVLSEDEGFWTVYREVTADVPTRGNLVSDAHLAALLRRHGVRTLWTADRDFLKFRFLDVRDPFA